MSLEKDLRLAKKVSCAWLLVRILKIQSTKVQTSGTTLLVVRSITETPDLLPCFALFYTCSAMYQIALFLPKNSVWTLKLR